MICFANNVFMQAFTLIKNKITTTIYQRVSVEINHRSIISKRSYKNTTHQTIWV